MEYKRYENYKNSGLDWLGKIPQEWCLSKVKQFYDICLGKMVQPNPVTDEDTFEKYLCSVNVTWDGINFDNVKEMWISPSDKLKYSIKSGDLIVCEGGDAGRASIYNGEIEECYIQNAVHRVRGKNDSCAKYLYYWLYFLKHIGYIDLICNKATIMHFTYDKFANVEVAIPDVQTQSAIVDFLDKRTSEIDDLIADKEKLIELLQEQRQAIITEAVTKGLNPNVKMKNSGIEWVDEIPDHWDVKKIKYLSDIFRGRFNHRPRNDPEFYDGNYPFIQTGDVSNAKKYVTDFSQTLNGKGYSVSKQFPKGTLVMTIAANIGDLAIINFDACFPDSIVGFFPRTGVDVEYLYYLFSAMKPIFLSTATLNTQLNLNIERVGTLLTVIPEFDEQIEIVSYLNKMVCESEEDIEQVSKQIDNLKAYRQSIISEAVTGKIDVRGYSA